MNRELWAEERRLQHARDRAALMALSLWAAGGYLLYLGCEAADALPGRWSDIAVTGVYLLAFFYVFAFWPILVAVDKLFHGPSPTNAGPLLHGHDHVIHYHGGAPPSGVQDGGRAIHADRSSIGSSRVDAGGASSPDAGS
jgi:hypothetical protein